MGPWEGAGSETASLPGAPEPRPRVSQTPGEERSQKCPRPCRSVASAEPSLTRACPPVSPSAVRLRPRPVRTGCRAGAGVGVTGRPVCPEAPSDLSADGG